MSVAVQIRQHWPGLEGMRHLVIFGDSYSQVGYNSTAPHPTHDNPLGIEFPGSTYNERGQPNWVGHLITKYVSQRLLVYDYAQGGHTLKGVRTQIDREFTPHLATKPEWAPWSEADSLFVTWVGINDCAFTNNESAPELVDTLFELQDSLYAAGARNFLLIDLPPLERSPAGARLRGVAPHQVWNASLVKATARFAKSHESATVLMFSAWDTFRSVLDRPSAFGFKQKDISKAGGGIWHDRLHPTSKMHDVIARDLKDFLAKVPAHTDSSSPKTEPFVTKPRGEEGEDASGCTCTLS